LPFIAQILNFYVVPLPLRVLYMNGCLFGWVIYLAILHCTRTILHCTRTILHCTHSTLHRWVIYLSIQLINEKKEKAIEAAKKGE
jgi:hypothetical protein